MANIAIRANNLGKQYNIGGPQVQNDTLSESITNTLKSPFQWFRKQPKTTFWALKDISFEINHGEVVGFIGENGAGKSTLLKVLSRITEPTVGCVEVYGRIGSLLEVGTGFHPELTGRENIHLNGAILGMKRAEINRKFDEIIAFADIEQFLDTPVKRYSSGMYIRLAFAIAAHLEPEILIVDEVLAVGDVAFQQKCLNKMGEVSQEGRTVLFVSHNMSAIQNLCGMSYLLKQGHIVEKGEASEVIDAYYQSTTGGNRSEVEIRDVPKGGIRFINWQISQNTLDDPYSCYSGQPCTLTFQLVVRRVVSRSEFGIALRAVDGTLVWAMRNLDFNGQREFLGPGLYEVNFIVPQFPLKSGYYQISVSVNDQEDGRLDQWHAKPKLQILPNHEADLPAKWRGILNIKGEFKLSQVDDLSVMDS